MALEIAQVDVWAADIEDRPGGLARKLDALAQAGANLEFVIARRAPDRPGLGVVYVTPLRGKKVLAAAQAAGFAPAPGLRSLRVMGRDKPGLGARITQAVAEAGISLRGVSAAAIGTRCVCYLAFDSADDVEKAAKVVRKLA